MAESVKGLAGKKKGNIAMEKRWFRNIRYVFWGICAAVALVICVKVGTVRTEAAAYTRLWTDYDTKAVKNGKYFIKIDESSRKTLIATRKSGPYKETPMNFYGAFANGKQAYYVRENVLYKYVFSGGKESKVKKLPVSGDQGYHISAVYGSQIFLTKSSFDQWKYWTYSYNTKSKKLKKAASDCAISSQNGKYVVAQNEYRSDVSPYRVTVYKITSSGLKKVKKLGENCHAEIYVNGKLYYTEYPDKYIQSGNYMKKVILYRCNPDGSGRKKLGTFTTSSQYGEVMVTKVTAKYCHVYKGGQTYKYTYKTKKLKKIR